MLSTRPTVEELCAVPPSQFGISKHTSLCTFSEQQSFVLAAAASRLKDLPAVCRPALQVIQAGQTSAT
jgi:hypothetical protein